MMSEASVRTQAWMCKALDWAHTSHTLSPNTARCLKGVLEWTSLQKMMGQIWRANDFESSWDSPGTRRAMITELWQWWLETITLDKNWVLKRDKVIYMIPQYCKPQSFLEGKKGRAKEKKNGCYRSRQEKGQEVGWEENWDTVGVGKCTVIMDAVFCLVLQSVVLGAHSWWPWGDNMRSQGLSWVHNLYDTPYVLYQFSSPLMESKGLNFSIIVNKRKHIHFRSTCFKMLGKKQNTVDKY